MFGVKLSSRNEDPFRAIGRNMVPIVTVKLLARATMLHAEEEGIDLAKAGGASPCF